MKTKEQLLIDRGYKVLEDGTMLNPNGVKIAKYIDNRGYRSTSIRFDGVKKLVHVHRLQAFQKFGLEIYATGIVVRHLNNNKLDNSKENILIGTSSENMMDIPKEQRLKQALHATSFVRKYNKDEVIEFHKKSKSYKKTMERFNISSKGTLHFILNNRKINK